MHASVRRFRYRVIGKGARKCIEVVGIHVPINLFSERYQVTVPSCTAGQEQSSHKESSYGFHYCFSSHSFKCARLGGCHFAPAVSTFTSGFPITPAFSIASFSLGLDMNASTAPALGNVPMIVTHFGFFTSV